MGLRLTDKGSKTFVLVARYPGKSNPEPRRLGQYGELTLEAARDKARGWIDLLNKGRDPKNEEERQRREEERKRANSFTSVLQDFVTQKLVHERKGKETERDIRRDLLPTWGQRPITEITELDLLPIINVKKRNAPAQARNLLSTAKRMFSWAKDQRGMD